MGTIARFLSLGSPRWQRPPVSRVRFRRLDADWTDTPSGQRDSEKYTHCSSCNRFFNLDADLMVKAISLLTLALSLTVTQAKAQSAPLNDSTTSDQVKPLERYECVIGSCLAFSLVDYLGYNILVKSNPYATTKIIALHVLDIAFGGAINYFLYKTCGLSSAISFDFIWWTWGLDLGFSGWGDVINPPSPWVNRA